MTTRTITLRRDDGKRLIITGIPEHSRFVTHLQSQYVVDSTTPKAPPKPRGKRTKSTANPIKPPPKYKQLAYCEDCGKQIYYNSTFCRKHRPRHTVPAETERLVHNLICTGMHYEDIARTAGIATATVNEIRKRTGAVHLGSRKKGSP